MIYQTKHNYLGYYIITGTSVKLSLKLPSEIMILKIYVARNLYVIKNEGFFVMLVNSIIQTDDTA